MEQKRKTKLVGKIIRKILLVLLTLILIGMTTAAICGMAFAVYVNEYVSPGVDIYLDSYRLNLTSFMYYIDPDTGEEVELEKIHGSEDRVWVDIHDIPEQLQLAFISVEDATFYTHNGVNWKRTLGAAANYVLHFRDGFGGGSTITQQLIKNLTGEDETSVKRKIQEVMRALELEKKYEKDDILELYLNTIYFGQSAYGVKQAANTYFGKELDELTLGECAAIAGITKNPYKYDLFRFPEFNEERRLTVLGEMLDWGNITQDQYDAAVAEKITTVKRNNGDEDNGEYQSYFVDAVMDQVLDDLQEQLGYSENLAKQLLFGGGLKIITTVDPEIQSKMDSVFTDLENFPGALGSDGTYPQASMVLMDPYTGHVKALYGGRGEKEGNRVLNRATSTYRQPGSSIKPITVYAPAMESGVATPISVVDDAPKDFTVRASGWPYNENRKYSGRCTVYRGIANSYNTVAVDLIEKVGYNQSYNFATKSLGLTSLIEKEVVTNKDGSQSIKTDLGASPLALGGLTKGVSVLEMTAAYSAFVNDGKYTTPVLYTKVYDSNGEVLLDNTPVTTVAMETKTRDYMIQLLTHVVTNGTGTKAAIDGIQVGGKTGTTTADNDRWFAGITPYYTGVVWFGYDMPQTLEKFSTNPALYLWREVMGKVHEGLEEKSFELKTEMVSVQYCLDSGMKPNEWCSQDIRGSRVVSAKVAKEDVPKQTCTCHVGLEIDPNTNCVANEFCPIEEIKTVGALNLQRSYPYNDVRITDQAYNIPYELTEAQTASGMFVPSTPTLQVCTEHNFENDANRVEIPVIPNPFDPLNPFNPFNPGDPGTSTDPGSDTDPGTTDEENDDNDFWFWPFN